MMLIAAALALASLAATDDPSHATIADAVVQRRAMIAKCAIPGDRLDIDRQEDVDMITIVVTGGAMLSDRQFRCFAAQLANGVQFSFQEDGPAQGYDSWRVRTTLADARSFLRRRGLLGALPRYDGKGGSLAVFARRLERLCGAPSGSALRVDGDQLRWIPDDVADSLGPLVFERRQCALQAAIATGFDPFAIPPIIVF